jgi:NAD(P)-dependent dehydrogenase (short-subunit alcohol dehydrogenase family)
MTTFADRILEGKTAYIAGGTRGMNLAIAKRFAAQGAKVAVMSRSPDRCASAAAEIEALGVKALGLPADARDYARVEATMKEASDAFGGLDIVVAGQAGNFYAPALGMSSKGFQTIIDIDLVGTFNVFRACFEHLRKPGASLMAISAPEAVKPLHFQAHVCAAKAGVNMLLKVLALEWGPVGVRVNGISPGPIEDSWGMMNVASPSQEMRDKITRAMPLRRWGKCADVANTALFLASDAASYITGTIIETDGGATIASPESGELDAAVDLLSDARVGNRKKSDD